MLTTQVEHVQRSNNRKHFKRDETNFKCFAIKEMCTIEILLSFHLFAYETYMKERDDQQIQMKTKHRLNKNQQTTRRNIRSNTYLPS